jgi:hypothetical protein
MVFGVFGSVKSDPRPQICERTIDHEAAFNSKSRASHRVKWCARFSSGGRPLDSKTECRLSSHLRRTGIGHRMTQMGQNRKQETSKLGFRSAPVADTRWVTTANRVRCSAVGSGVAALDLLKLRA